LSVPAAFAAANPDEAIAYQILLLSFRGIHELFGNMNNPDCVHVCTLRVNFSPLERKYSSNSPINIVLTVLTLPFRIGKAFAETYALQPKAVEQEGAKREKV
jgi:hypothetical protein